VNFPFYIAKRYLFTKKKHNAINIISAISVCGVSLATLALVCTLSVFNGFQEMVAHFLTAFDPELKIATVSGKVFSSSDSLIQKVSKLEEVEVATFALEEHAMIQYQGRQAMATLKGVEDNFQKLTSIDSILYGNGSFILHDESAHYAVMGIELVATLGTGIKFVDPLEVYLPKREGKINPGNPSSAFTKAHLFSPGVVFSVNQQEYDSQYIITSLHFMRRLLNYQSEATSLELKLKEGVETKKVQKKIKSILGNTYIVSNRYEQQVDIFKIMEVEKLISYLFLSFILLIASFNIISSLSMLIIDKKEDIQTLRNLGASNRVITAIFMIEGRIISLAGALIGIVIGLILCYAQANWGFIKLGDSSGAFIVDSYPVKVLYSDILLILFTVLVVGFLSVWYPIHYFSRKILNTNN